MDSGPRFLLSAGRRWWVTRLSLLGLAFHGVGSGHGASGFYSVVWRPAGWAGSGGGSSAVCLLAVWGSGPFFC